MSRTATEEEKPKRTAWERYGIVPLAIYESGLDPMAKLSYGYLDCIQGVRGRPAKSARRCAEALGISENTWNKHTRALAAAGLISIINHPGGAGSHGANEYEVLHNPARKRRSESPVDVPFPKEKNPRRCCTPTRQVAVRGWVPLDGRSASNFDGRGGSDFEVVSSSEVEGNPPQEFDDRMWFRV